MANTFILISKTTLSVAASTITFSNIPNTYTDLCLRFSSRANSGANNSSVAQMAVNNVTQDIYSIMQIYSDGTSGNVFTNNYYPGYVGSLARNLERQVGNAVTANTFSNGELYIPNYQTAPRKQYHTFTVAEYDNSTVEGNIWFASTLFSDNAAISSLVITDANNDGFAPQSTFYLYGIKNS